MAVRALRRLETADAQRLVLLGIGVALATLAVSQYLLGQYGPAVVVGLGSLLSSLFGVFLPSKRS